MAHIVQVQTNDSLGRPATTIIYTSYNIAPSSQIKIQMPQALHRQTYWVLMTRECSIKDKSVSGVVLGLNSVKVWKYTSSPLYGLFWSQLQHTFKCFEIYISTRIGSHGITYECSIKDKSVIDGIDLGLKGSNSENIHLVHCMPYFVHNTNIHSNASSFSSAHILGPKGCHMSVRLRMRATLASFLAYIGSKVWKYTSSPLYG